MAKFKVLGAHRNSCNLFIIEVEARDAFQAFGAAALELKEADAEGDTEFYAAIPAGIEFELPGDSVVDLDTVLDPEQADVFGLTKSGKLRKR